MIQFLDLELLAGSASSYLLDEGKGVASSSFEGSSEPFELAIPSDVCLC
jgi:hypothetical protein